MPSVSENVSAEEMVALCAVDSDLYATHFFPKTARQKSPLFHSDMDRVLENPANRYVAFKVFRGGAKTSKLRLFASKRIAYGISRTILIIGKSEAHALKSSSWIMSQVEFNKKWSQTFGLRKGKKWTPGEFQIIHGVDEYPIHVVAMGIQGSIRGLNIDDFRPDLIILDDVQDEENAATPEQREKIESLVYGALFETLAPESEAPDATIAMAQTPLDHEDLITKAMDDPQWASVKYSIFDENGESRWPERWSTELLLKQKQWYINRNQLPYWLREKECEVVTSESAAFKDEWLHDSPLVPEGGIVYIGIDPTPPPKQSPSQALKVVNMKLDDAVIFAIKLFQGKIFLLDLYTCKSPDPEEFTKKYFEMAITHRPFLTGIETVMNQRTLKWYMDREMLTSPYKFTILPVEDKRQKEVRIIQTVTRYAVNGGIYLNKADPKFAPFIEQYKKFQAGRTGQRDDILDALTIALTMINPALEGAVIEGEYDIIDEDNFDALEYDGGCP